MHYPKLEAAMKSNDVTIAQIAQCARVDGETAQKWMQENTVQFPLHAAFAVQCRLFPGYTIEDLFGKDTPAA